MLNWQWYSHNNWWKRRGRPSKYLSFENLIDKGTDIGDATNQVWVFERAEIDAVDGLLQFSCAIACSKQGCHDRTGRGAGEIDKFVSRGLDHRNCPYEADPLYPPP